MTSFRDRSICVVTPSRGAVDLRVHMNHLALRPPQNVGALTYLGCAGREVGEAYNALVFQALDTGATFILTLEDDMMPPPNAMVRLQAQLLEHEHLAAVSALYHTKGEDSIPLILGDPESGDSEDFDWRHPPDANAPQLVEVNAIPMGCAMWRADLFRALQGPWFATTDEATQDINFCRRARAVGQRFAVDCAVRAGHLDVRTGIVF